MRRALSREQITSPYRVRRMGVLKRELLDGLDSAVDDARLRLERDEQERINLLKKEKQKDTPNIPPLEWISSSYYTGDVEVWPAVKELFCEIVENGYNVLIFRGAPGWAKTFLARLLILRSVQEVGNIVNPHLVIGSLSKSAPLRISLVHINKDRAREELLNPLVNMVQSAGWFRDHMPPQARVLGAAGHESTYLSFFKDGVPLVRIRPVPTNAEAIVGNDMICAHLSECNRYPRVDNSKRGIGDEKTYDAAETIWKEVRTRLLTRFHKPLNTCIRVILDSSERYHDDFLDRECRQMDNYGLKFKIFQKSNWTTHPTRNKGPWFDFAVPRRGERGEVVQQEARKQQLIETGREIVQCPEGEVKEYLTTALADPDNFAREAGGWPTDAISPWLKDLEAVDRCRKARLEWIDEYSKRWELENPTLRVAGTLAPSRDMKPAAPECFMMGHSQIDWDALCHRLQGDTFPSPRIAPESPRFIHVDLADTGQDYVGFAVGCVVAERPDGPIVWIDLALRIDKPPGTEHDIDAIRAVIEGLRDKAGYTIQQVSFDQYQSSHVIQILRDRGFGVARISCHKTEDAYKTLRAALVSSRVLIDAGPDLTQELAELERTQKNNRVIVGHRIGGHDDLSDAIAGTVWQASLGAQISLAEPMDAAPALVGNPFENMEDTNNLDAIPQLSKAQREAIRREEEEIELQAEVLAMQREEEQRKAEREEWAKRIHGKA